MKSKKAKQMWEYKDKQKNAIRSLAYKRPWDKWALIADYLNRPKFSLLLALIVILVASYLITQF